MKFNLDIHTHTSDFSHLIFTKPNKKKYILDLLKKLFKKHGNIILGISNFNNDKRYEIFLHELRKLPKEYEVDLKYKDYFVIIKNKKDLIYVIKTNEITTDKGHMLIIGHKGAIRLRNLKKILKRANKNKLIIIANHPLEKINISYFLISKLFGEKQPKPVSVSEKELLKDKGRIDAIELNPYFPENWSKIKKFSNKNKIPIITNSDAHFLNEFFKSSFELDNISFKNPRKFKKSLKRSLKKNIIIHANKHNFIAKYKHGFQVFLEELGSKIGLWRN